MNLEILLCENDSNQNKAIQSWLKGQNLSYPIFGYTKAADLYDQIKDHASKRIVIMDIELDEASGIDVVKTIHQLDSNCIVIFLSAYIEKASDVYEVDHCYFVYKPQKEKYLMKAVRKAITLLNRQTLPLIVHEGPNLIQIDPLSILYLERIKRYTLITTIDKIYKVKEDFETLFKILPPTFVQTHRSYIVNYQFVEEYLPHDFLMKDKQLISISRNYKKNVHDSFQNYLLSEEE